MTLVVAHAQFLWGLCAGLAVGAGALLIVLGFVVHRRA